MKGVKEQIRANRIEDKKRLVEEIRSQDEERRILGDTASMGDTGSTDNAALPAIRETLTENSPERDIMSAMSAMSLANFKVVIRNHL